MGALIQVLEFIACYSSEMQFWVTWSSRAGHLLLNIMLCYCRGAGVDLGEAHLKLPRCGQIVCLK